VLEVLQTLQLGDAVPTGEGGDLHEREFEAGSVGHAQLVDALVGAEHLREPDSDFDVGVCVEDAEMRRGHSEEPVELITVGEEMREGNSSDHTSK